MKIIISHDVDHLYNTDHLFRDIIFPKLIVRSFLHLLEKKISIKTFWCRLRSLFEKRLNRIHEVMEIDKKYGVQSTFYFGMNQGLGMSYRPDEAKDVIRKVAEKGFDVGVHGIEFQNVEGIKKEHRLFKEISSQKIFGIRTHYVRFDEQTFFKFAEAGYMYDTSEFNKQKLEIKAPYKIGNMWVFPLHIMDGYIVPFGDLETGKQNTIEAIQKAKEMDMPYCTILYHDYQYNEKTYPVEKQWYDWLLEYLCKNGYEFISYNQAIKELEEQNGKQRDNICE